MSDPRGLFPRVGLKGLFTFSSPFDRYSNMDMEVIADKSFEYYARTDRDILEEIYVQNELAEEDYENHRILGVRIITLRYRTKSTISVPSIYIKSIPDDNLNYRWFQFVASLGILPKDIDLTRVQEIVKETLLENMGIDTNVILTTSDVQGSISIEDIELMESVRKNAVANASTYLKDKMMLEKQVEDLKGQVDHLMNIIYDADIRP